MAYLMHPKELIPPWTTPCLLIYTCKALVKDLKLEMVSCTRPSSLLSFIVRWALSVQGITLVEIFEGINIVLSFVL